MTCRPTKLSSSIIVKIFTLKYKIQKFKTCPPKTRTTFNNRNKPPQTIKLMHTYSGIWWNLNQISSNTANLLQEADCSYSFIISKS